MRRVIYLDSAVEGLVPAVMKYAKYLLSMPGPVPMLATRCTTGGLTYNRVVCVPTHHFFSLHLLLFLQFSSSDCAL